MPSRITPLDVKTFANDVQYRNGLKLFQDGQVKHRFQANYGLQATVRSDTAYRIEMIVDGEQLFGKCTCHAGNSPCEHQTAVLLAWLNEPQTFTSYQLLRKSIRLKEKNELVDILMNLIEIFPELGRFFVTTPGMDEKTALCNDVAEILEYPETEKVNPDELVELLQLLFIRSRLLRNEGKWQNSRILLFQILNRILSIVDNQKMTKPFPENFITEIADDYEDVSINDPDFKEHENEILVETKMLLDHDCAETEGVYLDQLRYKLQLD